MAAREEQALSLPPAKATRLHPARLGPGCGEGKRQNALLPAHGGNRPGENRLKIRNSGRYPIASSAHCMRSRSKLNCQSLRRKSRLHASKRLPRVRIREPPVNGEDQAKYCEFFCWSSTGSCIPAIHSCVRGPFALLKECESFKEKTPICSENSAAPKWIFELRALTPRRLPGKRILSRAFRFKTALRRLAQSKAGLDTLALTRLESGFYPSQKR